MILQSRRQRRPPINDRSPKMSLEDAATACKVDVRWLRALVGRSGLKPVLIHFGPNRRYYSLHQIQALLKGTRDSVPTESPA